MRKFSEFRMEFLNMFKTFATHEKFRQSRAIHMPVRCLQEIKRFAGLWVHAGTA